MVPDVAVVLGVQPSPGAGLPGGGADPLTAAPGKVSVSQEMAGPNVEGPQRAVEADPQPGISGKAADHGGIDDVDGNAGAGIGQRNQHAAAIHRTILTVPSQTS